MNLLRTTEQALRWNGKSLRDVRWVGSADGVYRVSWEEFGFLAERVDDSASGPSSLIPHDLVVVGPNWWMERTPFRSGMVWALKEKPQHVGRGLPLRTILGTKYGPASQVKGINRRHLRDQELER